MKIGIRATLQALLEADDLIAGKTLGESALTLVRRYRTALESARTMRNGIERLKHEFAEAQQSESKALARLDGAISATDNLRAQIVAITAERDDTEAARVMAVQGRNQADDLRREALRERDRMHDQWTEAVKARDHMQQERGDIAAQLATADERGYVSDCKSIAKQRDEALRGLDICRRHCDCTSEDGQ